MQLRAQLLKTGEVQRQLMKLQNELAGEGKKTERDRTYLAMLYIAGCNTKSACSTVIFPGKEEISSRTHSERLQVTLSALLTFNRRYSIAINLRPLVL